MIGEHLCGFQIHARSITLAVPKRKSLLFYRRSGAPEFKTFSLFKRKKIKTTWVLIFHKNQEQ